MKELIKSLFYSPISITNFYFALCTMVAFTAERSWFHTFLEGWMNGKFSLDNILLAL